MPQLQSYVYSNELWAVHKSRTWLESSEAINGGKDTHSQGTKGVRIGLPVIPFRLSVSARGALDAQVQLLTLQWGACTSSDSACQAQTSWQSYASTTAALALTSILHPGSIPALCSTLALPGLAATLAACFLKPDAASDGEWVNGSKGSGDNGTSRGGGAIGVKGSSGRRGQRARQVVTAGCSALSASAGILQRILAPSMALSLANAMWHMLHASSHALAAATVALLAVQLDCAQITYDQARGKLQTGHGLEARWRAVHQRAARRSARHLTDLPRSPPLQPLLSTLARVSVAAALCVDGVPLCGSTGPHSAGRSVSEGNVTGGNGAGGRSLLLACSVKGRGKAQQLNHHCIPAAVPATAISGPAAAAAAAVSAGVVGVGTPAVQPGHATGAAGTSPLSSSPAAGSSAGSQLPSDISSRSSGSSMESVPEAGVAVSRGSVICELHALPRGLPKAASAASLATFALVAAPSSASSATALHAPAAPRSAAGGSVSQPAGPAGQAALSSGRHDITMALDATASSSGQKQADVLGWRSSRQGAPQQQPPPHQHAVEAAPCSSASKSPLASASQQQLLQLPSGSVPHSPFAAAATAPVSTSTPVGGSGGDGGGVQGSSSSVLARLLREAGDSDAELAVLPLYGRQDHAAGGDGQGVSTSWRERLALTGRGCWLLAVFMPFLTLGVVLLLLAMWLAPKAAKPTAKKPAAATSSASSHGAGVVVSSSSGSSNATVAGSAGAGAVSRRSTPMHILMQRGAWHLLHGGCRRAGAAFIKWGQWAATRGDLFPHDFMEIMSGLHDHAPAHSYAQTASLVRAAYGLPITALFESFERDPLASGSVAQVHRAVLREELAPLHPDGATSRLVAVKVCHPGVAESITRDFRLLAPLAAATARTGALKFLNLKQTLAQFSATMTAQTDLRVEAAHLVRAYNNFSRVAEQVTTPRPLRGLARARVLVESFEPGHSVSAYMRAPSTLNTHIVSLGVDAYLKMLLRDNFVHTDLHPGNIMVRMVDRSGKPLPLSRLPQASAAADANSAPSGSSTSSSQAAGEDGDVHAQLVLLDYGLAEELAPHVRQRFISFLHAVMAGRGERAAELLLSWSDKQECPDIPAFTKAMVRLCAERCDVHAAQGVDLDGVLKAVLGLAREYEVSIESCYATLVIAVCVIVGFAAALDPKVNLVDAAVPCLLMHQLTGRVIGRLYS